MRRGIFWVFVWCVFLAAAVLLLAPQTYASFGKIQGIVHDPQHRPIAGATVVLKATTSDYTQTTQTDADGQFEFTAVTVGDYTVTVSQPGFDSIVQTVTVTSGSLPILHFQLRLTPVEPNHDGIGASGSSQHGFGYAHDADRTE